MIVKTDCSIYCEINEEWLRACFSTFGASEVGSRDHHGPDSVAVPVQVHHAGGLHSGEVLPAEALH